MKLEKIIKGITVNEIIGDMAQEISGINMDSRLIEPGHIFIAVKGTQTDGHTYIQKAIEKGARTVVCENLPETLIENVTYIKVNDTEDVVGKLATTFYGDPTSKLELVGVTGTNGKTTIATLLYNMFRKFGYKTGLISTVCNYIDEEAIPTDHTTPDPITLNKLLGRMADEGCKYAFMEVSSHSVAQKRIGGLKFAGGIFTNLTRDHLDYHKTVENYLKAKKAFFDSLPKTAFALTNLDDKNGLVMTQNTKAKVHTYSLRTMADFRCKIVEMHVDGMLLRIDGQEVWVGLVGRFNAYNLLAVYGAAVLLGLDRAEVLRAMSMLHAVSGRFEFVRAENGTTAIVDYAHTPDALENVIQTIQEIRTPAQQLIVVCGCGGDRDRTKRPEMAQIAVKYADTAIFTSDNPRHESPGAILDEMAAGLDPGARFLRIVDRAEAIRTAAMLSRPGDILLIAGKGHETYQIIGDVKHHFDDKEEVGKAFGTLRN